jgi:hypothetical protein
MQSALCCLVHDPKHWYSGMLGLHEHGRGPIQRFHENVIEVSLTGKLCIYTNYMVTFGNSVWMYYIEKLNNDEYSPNRKHLSVKYIFKCTKQPLGSLHYGYYMCEHLRTCG